MASAEAGPLDPCVHCGFCLPACPTYLATGDEADSPRGRIVLMRALERGEIGAGDAALVQHLDACLGCRGCETVCPSGVAYGRGLETARATLARQRGISRGARLVLEIFRSAHVWRPLFTAARLFRASGIPRLLARGSGSVGFSMAMLEATRPADLAPSGPGTAVPMRAAATRAAAAVTATRPRVALFRGCIMDTLFAHVHDATRRTLEANGYDVVEAAGQVCCGALHDHAGDRDAARALAARNIVAFGNIADYIVVNSAGCGALLKEYDHLVDGGAAKAFAARVRDVAELLAAAGPRPGAPLELRVAYDAPCHLQHAQRVQEPALAVLRAVPGLHLRLLPGSDQCCGSAGIYSLLHPAMSHAVLSAKIETFTAADPRPELVTTGNPGCLMQIGAGLRTAGLPIGVAHPVEILDWSYRQAGYYAATNGAHGTAPGRS